MPNFHSNLKQVISITTLESGLAVNTNLQSHNVVGLHDNSFNLLTNFVLQQVQLLIAMCY